MNKLDFLIDYLINENNEYKEINIPNNLENKKKLFRALCNLRKPNIISKEFLEIQDLYLKEENKITVDSNNIETIYRLFNSKVLNANKIALWQGDIVTLQIDSIVNAGNEYLLGCFMPNHHCIDNAIHFYSGIELRLECDSIMNKKTISTGEAIITKAYNLPSKYIIHTVGPIVYNNVTKKEEELLKNCYFNSLELARKNKIRTIAFPSISTGEYRFPKREANKIALEAVVDYLSKYSNDFDKIIFNVFTKEDYDEFKKLFN